MVTKYNTSLTWRFIVDVYIQFTSEVELVNIQSFGFKRGFSFIVNGGNSVNMNWNTDWKGFICKKPVNLLWRSVLTSTARLSRCLTTASCPLDAAAWRGVYPRLSLQLISAPWLTSWRTTSKWPAGGSSTQTKLHLNNSGHEPFFKQESDPGTFWMIQHSCSVLVERSSTSSLRFS